MSQEEFEITWEVDDGYVGGSAPHHLTVRLDWFSGTEDVDTIKEILEQSIWDDFESKVHWYSTNYKEIAAEIHAALGREEGE